VRLSYAGLSIRGPLGTRLYFRRCPKPCGTRRPCAHRGATSVDPYAVYLAEHYPEKLADYLKGSE
jgi:hypothetical protein